MLNSWPISFVVGTVLGALAGLGVGGGSILILWLTLVLDVPYEGARITNLLFFLPSATISTYFRVKRKAISIQRIWPAMVLGCVGAYLGTKINSVVDLFLLKKLFGGLLLLIGIRELLYRPRKAK